MDDSSTGRFVSMDQMAQWKDIRFASGRSMVRFLCELFVFSWIFQLFSPVISAAEFSINRASADAFI
jgi:hypothetical protein